MIVPAVRRRCGRASGLAPDGDGGPLDEQLANFLLIESVPPAKLESRQNGPVLIQQGRRQEVDERPREHPVQRSRGRTLDRGGDQSGDDVSTTKTGRVIVRVQHASR
jgi:hypothetical protein